MKTPPLGSITSSTCDRGSFFSNVNSPLSDGDRSMILICGTHQELKGDAAAPPIFFSQFFFFLHEARWLINDALMTEGRSRMIGSIWFESRVTWRILPPHPSPEELGRPIRELPNLPPSGSHLADGILSAFPVAERGPEGTSGNDPEIDGPVNQVTSQLSGFRCDRL